MYQARDAPSGIRQVFLATRATTSHSCECMKGPYSDAARRLGWFVACATVAPSFVHGEQDDNMAIRLVIDRDGLFDFKNCSRHRVPGDDDEALFAPQSKRSSSQQRQMDCQRLCLGVLPGYCFVMHHDCLQWNEEQDHHPPVMQQASEATPQPVVNIEQPSWKKRSLAAATTTSPEECNRVVQTLDWDDIGCTLMPNAPADCTRQLKRHVSFECVAASPRTALHN